MSFYTDMLVVARMRSFSLAGVLCHLANELHGGRSRVFIESFFGDSMVGSLDHPPSPFSHDERE